MEELQELRTCLEQHRYEDALAIVNGEAYRLLLEEGAM
jgi:hypothetical protein